MSVPSFAPTIGLIGAAAALGTTTAVVKMEASSRTPTATGERSFDEIMDHTKVLQLATVGRPLSDEDQHFVRDFYDRHPKYRKGA